jgi:serine/threonine-protein kinase
LTLAPPAREPDRIGNYELLGELGRRAMGRVYRARQTRAERMVALKVISDRELASPDHVERFHIEAEAAASLDHPNIVSIHEVGEHDEWHFFSVRFGVMGLPESTWRNRGPAAHLRRDGP